MILDEAGYTESILNTLEKNNVTAAFFITGHYLNTSSDLVKKMIENGNVVGNHTVNHECLPNLTNDQIKDEIMKLHNAVYEKTGYEMTFFRPPKGHLLMMTGTKISKEEKNMQRRKYLIIFTMEL